MQKSPVDLYLKAKKAEISLLTNQVIQSDYESLNGSTGASDSSLGSDGEFSSSDTAANEEVLHEIGKDSLSNGKDDADDGAKRKALNVIETSIKKLKQRPKENTRENVISLYSRALAAFNETKTCSIEQCHLLYDFGLFSERFELFNEAAAMISKLNDLEQQDYLLKGKILLQQAYYSIINTGSLDDDAQVKKAIEAFEKTGSDPITKISVARQLLDHALLKKSKLQGILMKFNVDCSSIVDILELCCQYCTGINTIPSYRIHGCALFHIANIESHTNNLNPIINTKKAINLLEKVVMEEEELIVSDYQLLSHSLLLASSLEEDDELAIEMYDKASDYLNLALELDPGIYN